MRQDGRSQHLAINAPELDIVIWKMKASSTEQSSDLAQKTFVACAARDLHLALVQLPVAWFQDSGSSANETGKVTCLRSVLMKPEHEAWLGQIWERWTAACDEVLEK